MGALASRFDGLSQTRAAWVLAALVTLIGCGVILSLVAPLQGPESVMSPGGEGDAALYQSIGERVRAGEDYYSAAADELRARHYALKPALNFRPPTLARLLAIFPSDASARWLLTGLTVLACGVWAVRFLRMGMRPLVATLIMLVVASGACLGLVPVGLYWHELWSGLCVMIALGVYGPRSWGWSALAAVAALAFRELALPLPVVMGGLALWNRRHREAAVWLAIILAAVGALGAHLAVASEHIRPDDLATTWSRFGGWNFILATARWNYVFVSAPVWVMAIVAPVSLMGLAGWKDAVGARVFLLTCAWIAAFMVFGRADNHYWGLIYSPLIAIGLAISPVSLTALLRSALQRPAPEGAAPSQQLASAPLRRRDPAS